MQEVSNSCGDVLRCVIARYLVTKDLPSALGQTDVDCACGQAGPLGRNLHYIMLT